MPTRIESGAREERKALEKRSHSQSRRMSRLCGKSKELWEDRFNGDACLGLLPLQRTARKHFTRRNCRAKAAAEISGSALVRSSGAHVYDTNREENTMATKRPSYLKKLKEQKRNARALEKRDAREARKRSKSLPVNGGEPILEAIEITESKNE